MRDRRRTPAGGVQAEKQQRYLQLIAQGVNNSEACRLVGIDRKTGNRWRYGRKVRNSAGALVIYPPVKIKEARPRSPRYLSEQERIRIADLLAAKVTVRGIALELGRAPSTISREIRRNSDPDGRYRPHHAEQAARLRACKPRKRRVAVDGVLAEAVSASAGEALEPGAGRARAARAVRRSAVAVVVQGDDLPGDLRPGGRAHPAGASPAPQATSAWAAAPRAADRDANDRRAPRRGRGPCPGRSLGRRPDHGCRQPVGDRNARGAHHQVPDPAAVPGWHRDRRRGPSGDHERAGEPAAAAEADADLGSGQGACDAPADHRIDRRRRVLLRRAFTRGSAAATRT